MGHSVHDHRWRNSAPDASIRLCAFSGRVAGCSDGGVFPGGEAAGTGHSGTAGAEETAGVVYAGGGGGTVGVWVLF